MQSSVQTSDHAVIETGADGKEDVTFLHGHVGFVRAVHPHHAEAQGACAVKAADAGERGDARIVEHRGEFIHRPSAVSAHGAAADV